MASETPFDQRLSNDAAAVDQCMKLGAVILKPKDKPPVGFGQPEPPREPGELRG